MPFDGATLEIDPLTLSTPRERLEYLAGFLRRQPPESFDMGVWHCGAAACIGGWCELIFTGTSYETEDRNVGALIGLTGSQHNHLFYPHVPDDLEGTWSPYDATPRQAAAVLDHLLNTGEVDWSVARKVEA